MTTQTTFLLDTHTLLWWWGEPSRLTQLAKATIENPSTEVLVSAASAWEVATKVRLGKLPARDAVMNWRQWVRDDGFRTLEIATNHALRAGSLKATHRDPFDRMLAAQCHIEQLVLISRDTAFDAFGVERVWD
jgi:PIN domain nuclease of toxin-antitoxin system